MVQKRVTAQGWLGSTPEGQRPQIQGLRAGGSLAVASSIPATQLSSPARLAEKVVTPHAPMTLGANHVSRAPETDLWPQLFSDVYCIALWISSEKNPN